MLLLMSACTDNIVHIQVMKITPYFISLCYNIVNYEKSFYTREGFFNVIMFLRSYIAVLNKDRLWSKFLLVMKLNVSYSLFPEPVKSYTMINSNNDDGSIEDDVNFYERELERYMQESLDSTERSRKNLEQSEQIGISTAQVLIVIFYFEKIYG